MGYGWNTRSPEEVQRRSGRSFTFHSLKERYEQTPPLRGKRKHLDIRPIYQRDRAWERMVKVNDWEYYITFNAYAYMDNNPDYKFQHQRAVTFKYNEDTETETIIVHNQERNHIGLPSIFYFYHHNLPEGLFMHKHHSKVYLGVNNAMGDGEAGYYSLKDDVVVTRMKGQKDFKPLVVHREYHRTLDKAKTKQLRKELEPFLDYMRVMAPLVEGKYQGFHYGSPLSPAYESIDPNSYNFSDAVRQVANKPWRELVGGHLAENPPEVWFTLAQHYKNRNTRTNWVRLDVEPVQYRQEQVFSFESLRKDIYRDIYQREKAYIETPVELGKVCFDKYRNW